MMISPTKIAAVVVMSVLFVGLDGGHPNFSLIEQVCTLRHYQGAGGYINCIYYVAYEIVTMTAKRGYSYSVNGRSGNELSGSCYGHAACNGELSQRDCTACLASARSYMSNYCTTSVGAHIKLKDCRIRLEDYPFDPDY